MVTFPSHKELVPIWNMEVTLKSHAKESIKYGFRFTTSISDMITCKQIDHVHIKYIYIHTRIAKFNA